MCFVAGWLTATAPLRKIAPSTDGFQSSESREQMSSIMRKPGVLFGFIILITPPILVMMGTLSISIL